VFGRFLFFGLLSLSLHLSLAVLVTGLRHPEGSPRGGEGISVEVWQGAFESPSSEGEEISLKKNRRSDNEVFSKNEGIGTGKGSPGTGSGLSGADPILAAIRSQIIRQLQYPAVARRAEIEGEVLVGFRINPEGTPSSIEIVRSSGSPILDHDAVAAVSRAAPYPVYEGPLSIRLKYEMGQ
jgi:TonB family protein